MIFTKLQPVVLVLLCAMALPAGAEVSAEIADLATRIDYGFYAEEPRVIDAARAALGRLAEDDPIARYYGAFAAFRSAQLRTREQDVGEVLDDCTRLATPAEDAPRSATAEGWILVAACASVGVERGLPQQRRREQALASAKQADRNNPRIALVEAWSAGPRPASLPAAARERAAERLNAAIAGFTARKAADDVALQWGEAEALAQLGEISLERGEARAARDLIERALLVAPEYQFALSVRSKLQLQ